MDMLRRLGSGTFAELAGAPALPTDVQLRTMGLRRAAIRTLSVVSERTRLALEAYAEGVNAYVATHALPPEYGALELSSFEPWTALDSVTVTKLITFDRSFDLDIGPTLTLLTYQQAGQALGFDVTALYFEDLFRSAPFDPAATVLDAMEPDQQAQAQVLGHNGNRSANFDSSIILALGQAYLAKIKGLPVFEGVLNREKRPCSNEWGISGRHTVSGRALLANDPHLPVGVPSTMYPIHLRNSQRSVVGYCFPGVPFVILGHNSFISWGGSVNYIDVTDTFQEQVVPDANSPSGRSHS